MISGTSAGAFIAAVYAMTRDTKIIESIVRRHSKNNHESRDLQVGRAGLKPLAILKAHELWIHVLSYFLI